VFHKQKWPTYLTICTICRAKS